MRDYEHFTAGYGDVARPDTSGHYLASHDAGESRRTVLVSIAGDGAAYDAFIPAVAMLARSHGHALTVRHASREYGRVFVCQVQPSGRITWSGEMTSHHITTS